jgi:hypothetical protein
MTPGPISKRQIVIAAFLFAVAMILYINTLAPTVAALFDDSLEFQLVTYELGIAHPTGYPLFTLLGWLFTRLPIGEVAFRVNLMSAFFGAITVVLVYLTVLQLGARQGSWALDIGAALGSSALAVSPVYWSQATVAEVYTLHACIVTALLCILLWIGNIASASNDDPQRVRARLDLPISMLACLFGLGLAHHRTIVLLLPAVLLVLWRARHLARLRMKHLLWFGVPLLLYLYLPLRGHVGSLDGSYANTIDGFLRYVTASGYGSFIFQNPFSIERGADFYLNLFVQQFGWVGIAFILVGVLLVERRGIVVGVTELAFLCYGVFNLFYRVADVEVFFIPNFLICALWLGYGIARLLTLLRSQNSVPLIPVTKPVALLAGTLIAMVSLFQSGLLFHDNFSRIDRSNDWAVHDYGLDILNQPLEPGATIVGIQGEITLVRYFQSVYGLRGDVCALAADDPNERLDTVSGLVERGNPVYLTRSLTGAPERWSLSAVGPLIRVYAHPRRVAPAMAYKVDTMLIPGIALWGYDIMRPLAHSTPSPVRLSLVWHALAPISQDLKISARLLGQDGHLVAQTDAVPVHFAYPTVAWRSGEFITDVYDLELPEHLPDGLYAVLLILYDPAKGATELARLMLSPLHLP